MQAADEDEVMFWDYGNPSAGGSSAAKQNGSTASAGQRSNGSAGGSSGSGSAKEKQASASRQQSKPAEDEPFAGTPMSPEFEVRQ